MIKIFPTLAFVLFSSSAFAQQIETFSSVVDLGQVQFYTPVTGSFDFHNATTSPVRIDHVDTGCGCTKASYPETEIAPGGTFSVQVTYDARMMGHFDKVIDVFFADNTMKRVDLKGVVVEEVEDYIGNFPFKLGDLTADCNYIEFEDVQRGEVFQQKFHVYNPTDKTVQPQIMHLPPYLKADVSPTKVSPNRSAEVTITLDSHYVHDFGLQQTSIYLGTNPGDRVSPSKEIGVSTVIIPSVQELTDAQFEKAPMLILSDNTLNLSAHDGKKKSGVIELQNIGGSNLEITKVQMFTVGIQVSLNKTVLKPGETAKLKISTDPNLLENLKTRPRVLLITNDPENGKVIIEVMVKG